MRVRFSTWGLELVGMREADVASLPVEVAAAWGIFSHSVRILLLRLREAAAL